jgi:hypothetical protein
MHLFRVDFITNHANGLVETGKVLVMAESHDMAHDLTAVQLNLPASRTRFDSSKIKPPCYQVDNNQYYPNKKVSVRSARDTELAPVQRYHITVQASNVGGQSEQQVMRKVGEELQARGTQTRLRHNLQMAIECSTAETQSKPPSTMEKIEMFGAKAAGRVQGGRVK